MIYRKQSNFDKFKCIADKCPKSCCIGWQIMIDEESLDRYKEADGEFAPRLKDSVNFVEGCFNQHNTRCSMLNDNGLCDLHSTLGEENLCVTCKQYPRHIEEFQDLREYSLSLSCPEAVRMLLQQDYDFLLDETEDEIFDDPEEFEDFDFLIFDKLEYARDKMFEIAVDKSMPLNKRLSIIANAALQLQNCYDDGDIFEMDDVDYSCEEELSMEYCLKTMEVLLDMEVLEESWKDSIRNALDFWQNKTSESSQWRQAMYPDSDASFVFEKIFKSLLFTYFCGAVYDGQIYARAMIAVMSTCWLVMLHHSQSCQHLDSTLYLYSREVEHSDLNVNKLISFFENEL